MPPKAARGWRWATLPPDSFRRRAERGYTSFKSRREHSREEHCMSLQTVASQFVELCNQGKNFDVMEAMYAPDIVSVEASGEETAGKTPVIQKSEHLQAKNTIGGEKVRGP